MKHIILGTAGHVDHGKTALIKSLTGIDTDRLKEEKERGITIELGFAQFSLKDGQQIGVVDVPGHERFVKNMVAGAGGIDVVAMVIAADEGIMPQTREHFDICQLLGVKKGIVALTKIDLIDNEWLDLVKEDIKTFIQGTFLEGAPIIPVSALTGEGLPELTKALETIIAMTDERTDSGFFRLPIDRVFTMRGFGTVVTGTLMSGKVNVGDTIQIMPQKTTAKIRGIQVHGKPTAEAFAGQRVAINIQGIDKDAIQRGNVLASPDTFMPSLRMDIFFKYLSGTNKKLKNRAPVRFHTGTSEIVSRIILPGRSEIEPGEEVFAQIILGSPTVAMTGDRFVIRSYSPISTIGGGEILDPIAKKIKRQTGHTLDQLDRLKNGDESEKTRIILERSGFNGISARQLSVRTGIRLKRQEKFLEEMFSKKEVLLLDRDGYRIVSFPVYQVLKNKLIQELELYHKTFPLKEGLAKEELRIKAGGYIEPKLFNNAVKDLEREGKLIVARENVRAPEHRVNLKGELDELRTQIAHIYNDSKLTPPSTKDIMEIFSGKKREVTSVLKVMLDEGILVKINEDMYFHKEHLDKLRSNYRDFLLKHDKATPAIFREMSGLSRKYSIPLMEYFDKIKLTIRVEDYRILRER